MSHSRQQSAAPSKTSSLQFSTRRNKLLCNVLASIKRKAAGGDTGVVGFSDLRRSSSQDECTAHGIVCMQGPGIDTYAAEYASKSHPLGNSNAALLPEHQPHQQQPQHKQQQHLQHQTQKLKDIYQFLIAFEAQGHGSISSAAKLCADSRGEPPTIRDLRACREELLAGLQLTDKLLAIMSQPIGQDVPLPAPGHRQGHITSRSDARQLYEDVQHGVHHLEHRVDCSDLAWFREVRLHGAHAYSDCWNQPNARADIAKAAFSNPVKVDIESLQALRVPPPREQPGAWRIAYLTTDN